MQLLIMTLMFKRGIDIQDQWYDFENCIIIRFIGYFFVIYIDIHFLKKRILIRCLNNDSI